MTERRHFNRRERAALYIAARGRCAICATPLTPGWHADHITPYSKSGPTDVINGQALCGRCNLQKGSRTIMTDLRPWQREALVEYQRAGKRDFLAVACPGAGKTTWALTVARTLLDAREINRVIVVVPSDALRTQWSDNTAAGIDLRPFTPDGPVDKDGYDGIVTTYQALGGLAGELIRNAIGQRRTLVILDEIHHAADTSSYGKDLTLAFEHADRRLLLTGTPWRTDSRERMPFVEFDEDNMLKVDYSYDYGIAVRDGVCRRIDFPIVRGHATWVRDDERKDHEVTVNMSLKGSDLSDATRTLLDATATGKWVADVLTRAHEDLLSIRREIPDAAGLIVAKDKRHAMQVQVRLKELTGVTAPVVVSAEDEGGDNSRSRKTIERFRESRDPWIIAVKMIAEGVDIPRLAVGVYATHVTTSMFFNQVVGRFVRVRPGEDLTARLYPLPTPKIRAIVNEIERMLPQRLSTDSPVQVDHEGTGGGSGDSTYTPIGSESNGLAFVHTNGGDVQGTLVDDWHTWLDERGIPSHYATQAASAGALPPSPVAVAEAPVPAHRREKELRDEIKALAGRVAYRCYDDYSAVKDVNYDLIRATGKSVRQMSIPQLEHAVDLLEEALETGGRL